MNSDQRKAIETDEEAAQRLLAKLNARTYLRARGPLELAKARWKRADVVIGGRSPSDAEAGERKPIVPGAHPHELEEATDDNREEKVAVRLARRLGGAKRRVLE